jgi:hypothetical protein
MIHRINSDTSIIPPTEYTRLADSTGTIVVAMVQVAGLAMLTAAVACT